MALSGCSARSWPGTPIAASTWRPVRTSSGSRALLLVDSPASLGAEHRPHGPRSGPLTRGPHLATAPGPLSSRGALPGSRAPRGALCSPCVLCGPCAGVPGSGWVLPVVWWVGFFSHVTPRALRTSLRSGALLACPAGPALPICGREPGTEHGPPRGLSWSLGALWGSLCGRSPSDVARPAHGDCSAPGTGVCRGSGRLS